LFSPQIGKYPLQRSTIKGWRIAKTKIDEDAVLIGRNLLAFDLHTSLKSDKLFASVHSSVIAQRTILLHIFSGFLLVILGLSVVFWLLVFNVLLFIFRVLILFLICRFFFIIASLVGEGVCSMVLDWGGL